MNRFNASPLPMEASADVHQAGIICRSANFGAGIFDARYFITQHGHRCIGVFYGKSASKSAALLCFGQFHQIDSTNISQ